jgi:hypothetical protein
VTGAREPPSAETRLDIAIWMAVFATPAMLAAWLLWRAWWRQAGPPAVGDGRPGVAGGGGECDAPRRPARVGRGHGGRAGQVQERAARRRFAAGCARAAVVPPGGGRAAGLAAALAVAAALAAALVTGAALPAGRVFALAFVGLLGALATLTAARSGCLAVVLVGGFLLDSRLIQPSLPRGSHGLMGYLFTGPLLVILPGSALAAALGRSFRSGLWACAWAVVLTMPLLITAWLAEALHWDQVGRGAVLDGAGPMGVSANLGDAVWWPLTFLASAQWQVPCPESLNGVLGSATNDQS